MENEKKISPQLMKREEFSGVKKRVKSLFQQMESKKRIFQDLRDYFCPNRGLFPEDRGNKEQMKREDLKLYNDVGIDSAKSFASGMLEGMTSPSRAWLRFRIRGEDFEEAQETKDYCDTVSKLMTSYFGRSNLYTALHGVYLEAAVFGNGLIYIEQNGEMRLSSSKSKSNGLGGRVVRAKSFASQLFVVRTRWVDQQILNK